MFLGGCPFTCGVIVKYIPNLRICVTMYVVPQYFLFSTPRSVIVLQQAFMVVFTFALDIRKGVFHGTRIWVHIGDMVAYYHPSLGKFENICEMVYSGGYSVYLLGDRSKCRGIQIISGFIYNSYMDK
jgi:hypothetical protein